MNLSLKKLISLRLFFFVFLMTSGTVSNANIWWLNISPLGGATTKGDSGILNLSGIGIGLEQNTYEFRYLYFEDGDFGTNDLSDAIIACGILSNCEEKNIKKIEEYSLLVGKKFSDGFVQIAGGIGIIKTENTLLPDRDEDEISIPLELTIVPTGPKYFRPSFKLSGSLSPDNAIFGVSIGFDLGKLKD